MAMVRQSRANGQRPTILLTRPLPQSRRFARALAGITDLPMVISPLMQAEALPVDLPKGPFSAIILTSETAVVIARSFPDLPLRAYCVGDRTAEVAGSVGFQPVSAQGDAEALLMLIRAAGETGPLLHLRGEESRGNLAENLTKGGLVTHEAVIYAQRAQSFGEEARALIAGGNPLIVPLFSPRSAQLFRQEIAEPRGPLWLAALSPAVAAELVPLHPDALEIAERPDATAMLLAVQRLIASACGFAPDHP